MHTRKPIGTLLLVINVILEFSSPVLFFTFPRLPSSPLPPVREKSTLSVAFQTISCHRLLRELFRPTFLTDVNPLTSNKLSRKRQTLIQALHSLGIKIASTGWFKKQRK
jgi:hypothetical protein